MAEGRTGVRAAANAPVGDAFFRRYVHGLSLTEPIRRKSNTTGIGIPARFAQGFSSFGGGTMSAVRSLTPGIGGSSSLGIGSYQNVAHDQSSCRS